MTVTTGCAVTALCLKKCANFSML